jgi:hypothetical protein
VFFDWKTRASEPFRALHDLAPLPLAETLVQREKPGWFPRDTHESTALFGRDLTSVERSGVELGRRSFAKIEKEGLSGVRHAHERESATA